MFALVTGVQTCALPIWSAARRSSSTRTVLILVAAPLPIAILSTFPIRPGLIDHALHRFQTRAGGGGVSFLRFGLVFWCRSLGAQAIGRRGLAPPLTLFSRFWIGHRRSLSDPSAPHLLYR